MALGSADLLHFFFFPFQFVCLLIAPSCFSHRLKVEALFVSHGHVSKPLRLDFFWTFRCLMYAQRFRNVTFFWLAPSCGFCRLCPTLLGSRRTLALWGTGGAVAGACGTPGWPVPASSVLTAFAESCHVLSGDPKCASLCELGQRVDLMD